MAYTQDKRLISIHTPLGADVLLLQSFNALEGISRLFQFSAEFLSENHSIAFKDIIGKQVTISLQLFSDEKRYWNGFVSRFSSTGRDDRFSRYHAEIVPWTWFLTRTADCQIFQQKTIPEIIKKVFQDHGFQDFQDRTQATYPQREYVVQYRETAFNFISRLMEECGIFYFFEHDENSHKLIFADKPQVHKNCPVQYKVRFDYNPGTSHVNEDLVHTWGAVQELEPGKYALNDYNFQTPNTSLLANVHTVDEIGGNTKYEIYDYPGIHTKKGEGDTLAKIRMEEEEAIHYIISGSGNSRTFASGCKFHLDEHSRADQNGDYLLTKITHYASVGDSYFGSGGGSQEIYTNHFTCIPFSIPFRPQRVTPKPIVQGPQTAVVVGPSGEEIYPDKYGRVKVQFFWDRLGKKDENSSCWIRVSQPWAGKNWGSIFLPRIRQEVIVEFLEGDPDRPIITGRVYNDEQMPPYTLPDNMTQSGFKTRSSPNGGSGNFNEIRFEDKKGSELLRIHAELNKTESVEADSREYVGHDRLRKIGNDRKTHIKQHDNLHIEGNSRIKIEGDSSIHVQKSCSEQIEGAYSLEATEGIALHAGKISINVDEYISINGPGGFVKIDASGITIMGTMVLINSGGAPTVAMPAPPKDPEEPDEQHGGVKNS